MAKSHIEDEMEWIEYPVKSDKLIEFIKEKYPREVSILDDGATFLSAYMNGDLDDPLIIAKGVDLSEDEILWYLGHTSYSIFDFEQHVKMRFSTMVDLSLITPPYKKK
ncbi:hypothetical protein [Alistipes sp.]|uniref:hypothetical protein n=1 Tax=Alistipes sp. TaxID=1872444 RepID=UPI000E82BA35|nr:hypothetical protein [Alistipes sp.]HAY31601.1 hypothetical protein [Alistipes sp.]